MKYVVYFKDYKGSDSLVTSGRENLVKELKALYSEAYEITKVCRIVKGEYVPVDGKQFSRFCNTF